MAGSPWAMKSPTSNPGAAADALVFVRAWGVVNTGGKKVLGAIAGVNETDYIVVNVAIVDSQSGAVLYYGQSATGGGYLEHPERLEKPMEASFKEWKGREAEVMTRRRHCGSGAGRCILPTMTSHQRPAQGCCCPCRTGVSSGTGIQVI